MPALRCAWLLLTVLACASSLANATTCRRPMYDRDDGRRWFGQSERVFIGDLDEVDDLRDNDDNGKELILSNPGRSVRGQFKPREVFKGPNAAVSIRINPGIKPGRNYLVFARRAGSELRADGACAFKLVQLSDPLMTAHKVAVDGLLAWLRALPPEGSGGELRVYLRDDAKASAHKELRFEGPHGPLSLGLDDQGQGQLDSVPAGAYRLATPAPPGYRYSCYQDCTRLVVHDRGLDQYSIQLNPQGRLRVQVVDANDKPIPLVAQFDLYRPDGKRVGPLGSSMSRYEISTGQDDAAVGFVEPGRYVLALVLPEFSSDRLRTTDLLRHFDGDAAFAKAPGIEVHDGDNIARFHLPAALRPVLLQVQFSGEPVDEALHRVGWQILVGREIGAYCESLRYSPPFGETMLTLRAIPGQTLQFTLYGHDINGQRDVMTMRPEHDMNIDLKLHKR